MFPFSLDKYQNFEGDPSVPSNHYAHGTYKSINGFISARGKNIGDGLRSFNMSSVGHGILATAGITALGFILTYAIAAATGFLSFDPSSGTNFSGKGTSLAFDKGIMEGGRAAFGFLTSGWGIAAMGAGGIIGVADSYRETGNDIQEAMGRADNRERTIVGQAMQKAHIKTHTQTFPTYDKATENAANQNPMQYVQTYANHPAEQQHSSFAAEELAKDTARQNVATRISQGF